MTKRVSENYLFILVVLTLTILDIALLERKYDLFTGGFLLPERIATLRSRALFGTAVLTLELSLAGCFWYLFHIIGRMRGTPPQRTRYLFLFLYGGGNLICTVVKYKILSYFGDFLSIAVLRNLGGGSLTGALRYGAAEFVQTGAWLAVAIIGAWLVFRRLKKRMPTEQAPLPPAGSMTHLGLGLLGCLLLLLGSAAAANANVTMRRYLPKTTPFALARGVIDEVVGSQTPLLAQLAAQVSSPVPTPAGNVSFGPRKDNLVLIVSESTRADVIGAEVAGRPVTP